MFFYLELFLLYLADELTFEPAGAGETLIYSVLRIRDKTMMFSPSSCFLITSSLSMLQMLLWSLICTSSLSPSFSSSFSNSFSSSFSSDSRAIWPMEELHSLHYLSEQSTLQFSYSESDSSLISWWSSWGIWTPSRFNTTSETCW